MEARVSARSARLGVRASAGLAERVFSRTAGAPLVGGNEVVLLRDAYENYPAWIEAIRNARRWIHFESYIIHEDDEGRRFVELLAAKAREGVKVRVLYDWVGGLGAASRRLWRPLREAGAEVRCFNPLSPTSPLGWMSRDHRKMIGVDGEVAFVTGLCVGCRWVGDPSRGVEPWRDTGIGLRGPAVADVERAFASIWAVSGEPLPASETVAREEIPRAGDTNLRVIAGVPNRAGLYRPTSSSLRGHGTRCGSRTRTSSGPRRTSRRSRPPRATASTCGSSSRARATSSSSGRCRG
jgi:cardiolipin synthase